MSNPRLDAGQGIAWLSKSIELLRTNPAPFFLMGLAIGATILFPLFGGLAMAVFGPAIYGGIIFAAREQASGRPARFEMLFAAFQQPGKLSKMLILCLPGLIAGVLIVVLAVLFIGTALVAAGVSSLADAEALASLSLGSSGLLLLLLIMALSLSAYATVFFAIPQVMLDDVEPMAAMKASLLAARDHWPALLGFLSLLLLALVLINVLLSWLPALLGHLLLSSALFPLVCCAQMLAYQQVFGRSSNSAPPPSPPPVIEL